MASSILKFETDRLITGVNIIDNMLFFTDDKTEPKKINIDVFKAAEHPSGNAPTTFVYGEELQERYITVMKEGPLKSAKTQLSNIAVGPNASEAAVRTDPADILGETRVRFRGWAMSLDTSVTEAGFYWIQSETMPSQLDIVGTNPKVIAFSRNEGLFDIIKDGLVANTKYYYVAYAYNEVGEEVLADNILSFTTDAATGSQTVPQVVTGIPLKISDGKYKLRGFVSSTGGSAISYASFLIVKFPSLSGYVTPSTLVGYGNNVEEIQATWNSTTNQYEANIDTGNNYFWVEFVAYNGTGQGVGGVKGDEASTGSSTLTGPIVNYINTTKRHDNSGLTLTISGKVTRVGNALQDRGFYFAVNNQNLDTEYANHATDPNIFKHSIATDGTSSGQEFKILHTAVTGLTLTEDDTLYIIVYGNDGVENRTEAVPFIIKNNASGINEPGIITLQPEKQLNNSNLALKVGLKVDSNGYNVNVSGFYQNVNIVKSLGCIIYKARVIGELQHLNSQEQGTRLIELLNENKATQVVFKENTLIGSSNPNPVNVTSTGVSHYQQFNGDAITSLEEGYEYYIMGFATNDELTGYGSVKSVQLANQAEQVPGMSTYRVVRDGSSNDNIFYGRFVGEIPVGQNNIYDAGFAYAPVVSGVAFNFATATYTSFNTLNGGTVEENTSIQRINNYIQNRENIDGGANDALNKWAISIPHTSLTAGAEYYVQAWVQLVQNGVKYPAIYETYQDSLEDGVISFENYEASAVVNLPTISIFATNITSSGANISGSTNPGNSGLSVQNLFSTSSDGIFFEKTATVGANNPVTWLPSNGTRVEPIFASTHNNNNYSYSFGGSYISEYGVQVALTALDPDTEYTMVAKVTNSAGSKTTPNPVTFKTLPGNPNFINCTIESTSTLDGPTIGFDISGPNDIARSTTKLYYIKTEDAVSSNPTAAEIVGDPDAGSYNHYTGSGFPSTGRSGELTANGLLPSTEYQFVWEMNFSTGGIKRSNVVKLTTSGGIPEAPLGTLSVDRMAIELGSSGSEGGAIALQHRDVWNAVEIFLSPNSGDYDFKKGSGDWSLVTVKRHEIGGRRFLSFHPERNDSPSALSWTCELYNVTNPSELTRIKIFQAPASLSLGGEGINVDRPLRDPNSVFSSREGYGSVRNLSSGNAANGTGDGRGSNTNLFKDGLLDGDGNPSWDVSPYQSLKFK